MSIKRGLNTQAVVEHYKASGLKRTAEAFGVSLSTVQHHRRKAGVPANGPVDFAERFWAKVDKSVAAPCWEWMAATDSRGLYGIFWRPGGSRYAHRIAYELCVGRIPEGLTIDHLCRNVRCVNPEHLEPVTGAENTRRSKGVQPTKTHCLRGHEFDEGNTHISPSGSRICRRCNRDMARAKRAAAMAERHTNQNEHATTTRTEPVR